VAGSRTSDGEQGAGAGQVVQLGREWFGPVAELIPFGPAAEARAEEAPLAAVSAADFWGGDADLLQEVVERADGGWDTAEVLEVVVDAEPHAADEPDELSVPRARERFVRHPIAGGLAAVSVVLVVLLVAASTMSGGVLRRSAVTASVVSHASDHHSRVRRAGVGRKRHPAVVRRSVVHTTTYVASNQTAPPVVSYSAPPPP